MIYVKDVHAFLQANIEPFLIYFTIGNPIQENLGQTQIADFTRGGINQHS